MMGFRVSRSHMRVELFLEDPLLTHLSELRILTGQENRWPSMVVKMVGTEEMILTKLMGDGDDMIRLDGFLMPKSKQQLVTRGDQNRSRMTCNKLSL